MGSTSTSAQATLLTALLTACMLAGCTANKGWGWGYGGFNYSRWHHGPVYRHPNATTQGPDKINVGGSENWHFGFNYTDWSIKHGPFYLNDVLGEVLISLLSVFFIYYKKYVPILTF